jgi:hypothetical protein
VERAKTNLTQIFTHSFKNSHRCSNFFFSWFILSIKQNDTCYVQSKYICLNSTHYTIESFQDTLCSQSSSSTLFPLTNCMTTTGETGFSTECISALPQTPSSKYFYQVFSSSSSSSSSSLVVTTFFLCLFLFNLSILPIIVLSLSYNSTKQLTKLLFLFSYTYRYSQIISALLSTLQINARVELRSRLQHTN